MTPNILTIAGSDSSGGAGIQADIKTISACGGYAMSVITALTAQNTQGVKASVDVPARFVSDQIRAVFEDSDIKAVKIGMLSNGEIIEAVADCLKEYKPAHIVLDPVMVATSGDSLITTDAIEAMKTHLIPLATLITPNIPEAEKLLRKAVIDMDNAAKSLLILGCPAALLKGGHAHGQTADDILATSNGTQTFSAPRIETQNTHGTGCTLSSAIATYLGTGLPLPEAIERAKAYLTKALKAADQLSVGQGKGPAHHFWRQDS